MRAGPGIAAITGGGEGVTTSAKTIAEALERLWTWSGSIIEEMEELRAAIATLYASAEGRGMTGGDLEAVLERSEPCGFCLRAMQKLIYEERDKITRKEYYGSIENKKRLP